VVATIIQKLCGSNSCGSKKNSCGSNSSDVNVMVLAAVAGQQVAGKIGAVAARNLGQSQFSRAVSISVVVIAIPVLCSSSQDEM
jgi:ABC-type methionine transport system permease subunit